MLLIAIPKSASTSLMKTLGDLHGLEATQDMSWKDNEIPAGCAYLHQVHSDIREVSEKEVAMFERQNIVYKQHIFPSENNLKKLSGIKKVVLLREPESICEAYHRGNKKKVHTLLPGFEGDMDAKEWKVLANEKGLISDLNFFHDTWYSLKNRDDVLVVQYEDLISDVKKVVREVEEFWEWESKDEDIVLARERYSRRKGLAYVLYLIKYNVRTILVRSLELLGLKKLVKRMLGRN